MPTLSLQDIHGLVPEHTLLQTSDSSVAAITSLWILDRLPLPRYLLLCAEHT